MKPVRYPSLPAVVGATARIVDLVGSLAQYDSTKSLYSVARLNLAWLHTPGEYYLPDIVLKSCIFLLHSSDGSRTLFRM